MGSEGPRQVNLAIRLTVVMLDHDWEKIIRMQLMLQSSSTHLDIMEIVHPQVKEQPGEQGRYVRRVGGEEDDREAAPDVDEHLVGP